MIMKTFDEGDSLPGEIDISKLRKDDLQLGGLMLFQDPERFCFGSDAVFLTDFVKEGKLRENAVLADLCTGTGVIPILLSRKIHAGKMYGVEIQKPEAQIAGINVAYNGLEGLIDILNADIRTLGDILPGGSFDAVTANPPYISREGGLLNPDTPKTIARHEVKCTLRDVLECAFFLLKEKGRFFMVHRPQRLAEILHGMCETGIEPKRIRGVYADIQKPPAMLLIEGRKHGGSGMWVDPPLVLNGKGWDVG